MTVAARKNLKLSPRFYGPFQVVEKIGSVAYRLDLPVQAQIHPVFHVSQLKRKVGTQVAPIQQLPPVTSLGTLGPEPVEILSRRLVRHGHLPITEVLVRWQDQSPDDATWEKL